MAAINIMVEQCSGLLGTNDLNDWEEGFIQSVYDKTKEGKDTRSLTEKQIDSLERIWRKHFTG